MTSRRVFLTHSPEVAGLLAEAHKVGKDRITRTGFGCADNREYIPSIYCDRGYFYCLVEADAEVESYELIIC